MNIITFIAKKPAKPSFTSVQRSGAGFSLFLRHGGRDAAADAADSAARFRPRPSRPPRIRLPRPADSKAIAAEAVRNNRSRAARRWVRRVMEA